MTPANDVAGGGDEREVPGIFRELPLPSPARMIARPPRMAVQRHESATSAEYAKSGDRRITSKPINAGQQE